MPLLDVECQLARGQVSRYLEGERLSENAIVQLEEHLNECPNCVDFFEAKKTYLKRLSELDAAPAPTHAVIEVLEAEVGEEASEEPSPQAKSLIEAILKHKTHLDKVVKPAGSAIDTNDSPKPSRDLTAYYKPTMYLVGLALTLVLMGIFMKDPTRFLGDKVGEGTNSNQAPATTPTTTRADRWTCRRRRGG